MDGEGYAIYEEIDGGNAVFGGNSGYNQGVAKVSFEQKRRHEEMTNEIRWSGNPLFEGWYADPELHIFENRYYMYPTFSADFDQQTFFDAWSSLDLTDWQYEGKILDLADVPWSGYRAAWAPTICERAGTYYIYFSVGDGTGIGVATANNPTGPFKDALGGPLIGTYPHGAQPIDAHVFLDDDDQAYLYFGGHRHCVVVKLGADMVTLASDFIEITPKNYVEGPFMVKRQGLYYLMWSEGDWGDSSYQVAYGQARSPLGPFERAGLVLQSDSTIGNGTGHHSVVNIPGTDEWYIAYHRRPLTSIIMHERVVCIDRLIFDTTGAILPVRITTTGVPARPLGPHA